MIKFQICMAFVHGLLTYLFVTRNEIGWAIFSVACSGLHTGAAIVEAIKKETR